MSGIIETALANTEQEAMPWTERFKQLSGYTPETVGIKSEAEAQSYLTRLEELKTTRAPASNPDPSRVSEIWGKTGATGRGTGTRPTK